MQESDRKAFGEILAEIFAAIDKPLGESQRSAFWKALKDLSLLEFARCRDLLIAEYREFEEPPRKFTVGDIWRARKKLRARPPSPNPEDTWQGDDWDMRANQRLLSFILRMWHRHNRHFSEKQTWVLVAHKNRWAKIMRDSGDFDAVAQADQDASWAECIRMAEAEIARPAAA